MLLLTWHTCTCTWSFLVLNQPYVLEMQPPALLLPAFIPLATETRRRVKVHVCIHTCATHATSVKFACTCSIHTQVHNTCTRVYMCVHTCTMYYSYQPIMYTFNYKVLTCEMHMFVIVHCSTHFLQMVSHSVSTLHYTWRRPLEGITITPASGSIG